MHAIGRSTMLWGAGMLVVAALCFLAFGLFLIMQSAFPLEEEGALGHVGMMTAGIIASLLGAVLGACAVLCFSRARRAGIGNDREDDREDNGDHDSDIHKEPYLS